MQHGRHTQRRLRARAGHSCLRNECNRICLQSLRSQSLATDRDAPCVTTCRPPILSLPHDFGNALSLLMSFTSRRVGTARFSSQVKKNQQGCCISTSVELMYADWTRRYTRTTNRYKMKCVKGTIKVRGFAGGEELNWGALQTYLVNIW